MTSSMHAQWLNYFSDIGLREDLVAVYMPFVDTCIEKGIPPIFEHEHLALLLGVDVGRLMNMVFGTASFYREFRLRKRSGGYRIIRAPYPSLLEAQKWINSNILSKVALSICAMGFREGKSIADKASIHCERKELLKLDIEDFFPSISFSRVMEAFCSIGYPQHVSFFLSRLCTLDNQLPQGAATSPALSNIICSDLDNRMYKFCRKRRLRYTRYADDMTFSGSIIRSQDIGLLSEIISSEGFTVKHEKTRYIQNGEKKIVTGLDITNGKPRPTREFRREIKKDVYFVWSSGLATHAARRKIFEPQYIDQLRGRLAFWLSIEPDNLQLKKTLSRFQSFEKIYR